MKTWKEITYDRFATLHAVEDLVVSAGGRMLEPNSEYTEYATKSSVYTSFNNTSCWDIRLRSERIGNEERYFEYK